MSEQAIVTLLSRAWVAFTIECDNEAEHRMAHRTSRDAKRAEPSGPWLVSIVMWWNCMRFVGEAGVTVADLERLARTPTNLGGMRRWGYVTVTPRPAGGGSAAVRSDAVIRATRRGRSAQKLWRTLIPSIEERWRERFGGEAIDELTASLRTLVRAFVLALPDCLPILGYGLQTRGTWPRAERDESEGPLPALLAKALLAFTIAYERNASVSLAIGANVLRLVGADGVRVRDLPKRAAVSKEGIAMALGFLERGRYAAVAPERAGSRVKVARLTTKGRSARDEHVERMADVERRWRERFGADAVDRLRAALETVVGTSDLRPALLEGVKPYADGWRAAAGVTDLPYYPLVLHRGGFPDGS